MEDGFPQFANNAPVAGMPDCQNSNTDCSFATSDDTMISDNECGEGKRKRGNYKNDQKYDDSEGVDTSGSDYDKKRKMWF